MESLLSDHLSTWLSSHQSWLGPVIFAIALLESLAIAGLLVPGVVLLFAVTAIAGSSDMSIPVMLGWAFAGAICGDLLSFALGRLFHQDIRRLRLFQRYPQWIDQGERFFRRYGMMSVLIGRFFGPVRPIIPMIAGMFDMPFWRFLAVSLLSALAWAPVYALPGYTAGHALTWPVPQFFWPQTLALTGALAGLGLLCLWLLKAQHRWSNLACAALLLIGAVSLPVVEPWLEVVLFTSEYWISQRAPLLGWHAWLTPLTDLDTTLWLLVPGLAWLTLLSPYRQPLFALLTLVIALGLGWLLEISQPALILTGQWTWLVVVAICLGRDQGFWMRCLWLLYPLLLGAPLAFASLVITDTSILSMLQALLLALSASALASWAVERGAPIHRSQRWRNLVLLAWAPLVILSGLH